MLSDPTAPYTKQAAAPQENGRAELIRAGLPLVRRMAFRMARRLPPNVDVNDLIGAGTEGLLKAVQNYDAERYPHFEPYAKTRIRGAILDELRANDSLTRYGRSRMAEITNTIKQLQHMLGRQPAEDEIAAKLGMPLEQYQRMTGDLMRGPTLQGLSSVSADDAESSSATPDAVLLDSDMKRRLGAAMAKLTERTQHVLALYYQEECTQAEIGEILGVTESRVCQVLGEATARLRALLEEAPQAPDRKVRALICRKASTARSPAPSRKSAT
jgi:RNA polymerase sigma factor for flagellar operon FliA